MVDLAEKYWTMDFISSLIVSQVIGHRAPKRRTLIYLILAESMRRDADGQVGFVFVYIVIALSALTKY